MKQNTHVPGTREQMNGSRKLPQGVKVASGIKSFDTAWDRAKRLEKQAKNGETYNVSGVGGDYCLLKYGAKLEPDPAYLHMS